MLKKRDEEERDMWVDQVRNTQTPTSGQIFLEIYERRQETWIFDKEKAKGHAQRMAVARG